MFWVKFMKIFLRYLLRKMFLSAILEKSYIYVQLLKSGHLVQPADKNTKIISAYFFHSNWLDVVQNSVSHFFIVMVLNSYFLKSLLQDGLSDRYVFRVNASSYMHSHICWTLAKKCRNCKKLKTRSLFSLFSQVQLSFNVSIIWVTSEYSCTSLVLRVILTILNNIPK